MKKIFTPETQRAQRRKNFFIPAKQRNLEKWRVHSRKRAFRVIERLLDSRVSRDFYRAIYLTLEHLFKPEVQIKIIKPRDGRFYPFCRESLRQILVVLFEEIGMGCIIISDHNRVTLYPDVPL